MSICLNVLFSGLENLVLEVLTVTLNGSRDSRRPACKIVSKRVFDARNACFAVDSGIISRSLWPSERERIPAIYCSRRNRM
jgi:hypothetical protein